jgi:hypothetical protein
VRKWLIVATLAIAGCSSPTGAAIPDVVATLQFVESGEDDRLKLTTVNLGTVAVTVGCESFTIEGLTIEGWETVIEHPCDEPASEYPLPVPPQGSHVVEFAAPAAGPQYRGAVRFSVSGPNDQWIVYSLSLTW